MTNMTVAKTILEQLGGNRFLTMTGAKNFVGSDNALRFRLPRAKDGINTVEVKLNSMDTYTVTFSRVTVGKVYNDKQIAVEENVYADMLQSTFTERTGLYTKI